MTMSATSTTLMTAKEFARRPRPADGSREELVRGEVVTMPPPGFRHGKVAQIVGYRLMHYLETHPVGTVTAETGVQTEEDPDSVRGPDVSYWSFDRLPADANPEVYAEVAADLCVEVRSPSNTAKGLREKAAEYLKAGVRMVWVEDPEDRCVTVFRKRGRGVTLWDEEVLEGEDVLPGFACPVSKLFAL
jgi:Uma2 family endonuclease